MNNIQIYATATQFKHISRGWAHKLEMSFVLNMKNFKILTAPNEIKSVQKLCAACEVVKMMTFHSKALILHQFSSVQILSRVQLFAFP